MLTRFRAGSIRRQIVALAIGPIICLVLLGTLAEFLLADDAESVSYARITALKVETVIEQFNASVSPGQQVAVLDAVSRTGLKVEAVSSGELQGDDEAASDDDIRELIRKNLPDTVDAAIRARTGGALTDVLVVDAGNGRALAFKPSPAPTDTWINDSQVSVALQFLGLFLPVVLLSFYAAYMITAPLLDFAAAAQALDPDKGPDRPFVEKGATEIRTLARSLNDMRSRVRGMIDDRTRMLRAISHDLRTPLTRLRLRAERSGEPQLKAALLSDISALNDMINDTLLYLSKDMASEAPVNADLPSVLTTVSADFADVGFDVTYHGPERLTYRCKPRALARAITNLVENSSKFAKTISIELLVREDGAVRIRVVDDGPGLPVGLSGRVLEPFFKVDTARPSTNRSGFGLSIVDDIVRAHSGTIALVNRQPHGLDARIDLPPHGIEASATPVRQETRRRVRPAE